MKMNKTKKSKPVKKVVQGKKTIQSKIVVKEKIENIIIEKINRKQIFIHILANCFPLQEEKPGSYTVLLEYNDNLKKIQSDVILNTTSYRMMIEGVIKGLELLKEPCEVEIYTKGAFGAKAMEKVIKGKAHPNSDLLIKLNKTVIDGQHLVKYFVDSYVVDSMFGKV